MKKILFTGGGGAGNEALLRLMGERYELHFADADREAIDPTIPEGQRHEIPFANVPEFGKKLTELFQTLEIDLLVPGVDEELPIIAALIEKEMHHCRAGTAEGLPAAAGRSTTVPLAITPAKLQNKTTIRALLPPKAFVETHLDKASSMHSLEALGVTPKTVTVEKALEVGFPCIAKPRSGRGSRGVAVIKSPAQLDAYLAFHESAPESVIVQELGIGDEFTVMMAADSAGALRAVVPVKVGIKRGITLRAETVRDEAVEAACRKIHEANPAPGCYNIQLIRQDDGRILVFEINPRVSTTLCLGVAAGINPVDIYLQEPTGPATVLRPFTENLQLHRFWSNRFK